jgi:hypothetical protein
MKPVPPSSELKISEESIQQGVGGKPVFCPFLDGWLLWLSLPQNYQ